MSDSTARDHAELDSKNPAEALLQWRETRDADRYRQWCLDMFEGYVRVGEHEFHPAEVLRLKPDVVEKTISECRSQLLDQDDETICAQFPSPIAIPYQQTIYGPRDPNRRLTRMRDTWEGLINLLFAMVIAEAGLVGIGELPVQVIETASRRAIKHKDLRSDKLSVRIGIIEGILESWRATGVRAVLADLIPSGLPAELRRLNTVRNGFSHLGTLSDVQAAHLIDESRPILHDVLVDCLFLADTQLVRLIKVTPGVPPYAEVDRLNGHSTARHVTDLELDADAQKVVMQSGKVGSYDRVLAKIRSQCLDLSPYFYACDDDSGHHTRIAFFKKRAADTCHLEVVGESLPLTSAANLHAPEFARCEVAVVGSQGGAGDE
ncbi:hypothetical protein [Burkholderia cenocepacia]|jgi:hypothetical protein|uniref:Uncharacterized protein n=2 Tax=Burkholderia cenocepacia TaxID=95486 RepID=B4E7C7_BURCJ|nr:hypothetical protein [Burkholderia cenocepacia]KIS47841.1 hypothetical protein NP88_3695 [Burkholderia cepacia]QKT94419.1 hypothetical protein FOC42_21730 [Burkholderia cenocepacia]CAR50730.1 hypothetical protein BCAL0419 [Burkholderia cenocepacia J2315]SPU92710.1 Uncharacterised protein [Burkholderia cenocepacia]HEF5183864.1 hypothetical protein [Burkholderia cenocepacia]